MAVFSNVDIDEALRNGTITIEGSNGVTRHNSRDIYPEGDVWEVTGPEYNDIMEIHRRLGARGVDVNYHLPDVPRRSRRLHHGDLAANKVYVMESPTITTAEGIKVRLVPRSTAARNAVHAFSPVNNQWIAVVTYGHAELDRKSITQAVFYDKGTKSLTAEETRDAIDRGGLFFSRPHVLQFGEGYGYVPLHFSKVLDAYSGGVLKNGGAERAFRRGKRTSIFDFRLGMTEEEIGAGPSYVMWMTSDEGYIHPNAPLINATVSPNRHTLEVLLSPEEAGRIMNGKKPRYACSVRAYPLKTPTTMDYAQTGRYNNQAEPVASRFPADAAKAY
ncbi:MAG: hypothetical protein HY365_02525 [Candidatus Aenigmarchaeota archaeon]|nr:hypothetical protein [Candidatus Aenigmarchaeota archaeon]